MNLIVELEMRAITVLLAVFVGLAAALTDLEEVSADSVVSLSDAPPSGAVRPAKSDERPTAGAALGTKGNFILEHASAAPKLNLLELGEDEGRVSLAEAAKILHTVAGAADSKATISRRDLDAMIREATKPKGDKMLGATHLLPLSIYLSRQATFVLTQLHTVDR